MSTVNVRRLLDEVRLLNNLLIQLAGELHADLGLGVPARAVLEFLHAQGPTPVPEIARIRNVSRQHIQTIADGLIADGLVEPHDNPAHRRSPLLALTELGQRTITTVLRREERVIADRLAALPDAETERAARLLARLRAALADA